MEILAVFRTNALKFKIFKNACMRDEGGYFRGKFWEKVEKGNFRGGSFICFWPKNGRVKKGGVGRKKWSKKIGRDFRGIEKKFI